MSPACRCGHPVGEPHPVGDPHEVGCVLNREKCLGCGHALSKHRHYANGGRNRHGSTLVCSVDNCAWTECRMGRDGGEG